jgi:hypothetical protein
VSRLNVVIRIAKYLRIDIRPTVLAGINSNKSFDVYALTCKFVGYAGLAWLS